MQVTMEMLNSTSMKKIFGFELSRVSYRDREDVRHNCIVEILKATKGKGDEIPLDKFPSFCQTIIKRTVVDHYRRKNRLIDKNTVFLDFESSNRTFTEESKFEPRSSDVIDYGIKVTDMSYDVAEIKADYDSNIDKFTKREREVLDYMLYAPEGIGMTMAEIARELQVNKSSATRAVQKLRGIVTTEV